MRENPKTKEKGSIKRWEAIAHVTNTKGMQAADDFNQTYGTKNFKSCQEKFYAIMELCSKNEFKHQRTSGTNEVSSQAEKEAYDCFEQMVE